MTKRDEQIIETNEAVRSLLVGLSEAKMEEKSAERRKKRIVRNLLASGLSSRFLGRWVDVSHVTIARWGSETYEGPT